jgi:hypothetical protein
MACSSAEPGEPGEQVRDLPTEAAEVDSVRLIHLSPVDSEPWLEHATVAVARRSQLGSSPGLVSKALKNGRTEVRAIERSQCPPLAYSPSARDRVSPKRPRRFSPRCAAHALHVRISGAPAMRP